MSRLLNVFIAGLMACCFMLGMLVADTAHVYDLNPWFRVLSLVAFAAAWYAVAVWHERRKGRKA